MGVEVNTKKRKPVEQAADDASASSPRKSKKHRKNVEILDQNSGSKPGQASTSEFRSLRGSTVITIPPLYANNPRGCAEEMLDSMVMRYMPALGGVLLSHSHLEFVDEAAKIIDACPFAVCTISFLAMVWGPNIGTRLKGKISLCSPDHISLLVHRTFNVSIPRHHIPAEDYEFEWAPLEVDPEYGPHAVHDDGDAAELVQDVAPADGADGEGALPQEGKWVRKDDNEILGGESGFVEFTVIALKLANQMLSLVGSIQPDPFSELHIPQPAILMSSRGEARAAVTDEADDVLGLLDDADSSMDVGHGVEDGDHPPEQKSEPAAEKRKRQEERYKALEANVSEASGTRRKKRDRSKDDAKAIEKGKKAKAKVKA